MFTTQAFTIAPPDERARTRSIPIGSDARCLDGTAGTISRAVRDSNGVLTHLVVRRPGMFVRHVLIPGTYISHIDNDCVALELRRAELNGFPEHRDDTEITADIEQSLRSMELFHDRDDFVDVCVRVVNGIVALRGHVRNEARRQEAGAIAARIRGVREVHNHLFADAQIARTIEQVLSADPRLRGTQIRAVCRFGVADLFGETATRAERAVATLTARQVPGVNAINNLLRVAA